MPHMPPEETGRNRATAGPGTHRDADLRPGDALTAAGTRGGAFDGLTVAGPGRIGAVECRLSDLLSDDGGGPDVFLADLAATQAAAAAGFDPVLYQAVRDVFPPRVSSPVPAGAGGQGSLKWSADLVIYQHGVLPGGEPFRSIGHWNPAGQLEIFQVLSGRVLMVTSGTSISGRPYAQYQECRSGEVAVVPFGGWHLTYVLDGPAMVFNIYTCPCGAGPRSGAASEPAGMSKYRSWRGPAQIAAARVNGSLGFVLGPEAGRSGEPAAVCCPDWLRVFLPQGASLPDWCVRAAEGELRGLAAAAQLAARSGWPS
jgi:hypothetical protein